MPQDFSPPIIAWYRYRPDNLDGIALTYALEG
jgi:hypothetical protein